MPRARSSSPQQLTPDQLTYLAGVVESGSGITGTNSQNAVAIGKEQAWQEYMAKTYGGEAKPFTSNAGKQIWGWYVPMKLRLDLFQQLEKAQMFKTTSPSDCDKIRGRLQKAIPLDERDN